jgi:hypothetical protein
MLINKIKTIVDSTTRSIDWSYFVLLGQNWQLDQQVLFKTPWVIHNINNEQQPHKIIEQDVFIISHMLLSLWCLGQVTFVNEMFRIVCGKTNFGLHENKH